MGRSLSCRRHFGNLGILEGYDLPLGLFLNDDQGLGGSLFRAFDCFL
jgi:hypothetical protein